MAKMKYILNGIEGLSAISKAYGVPVRTLRARMDKGQTLAQAAGVAPKPKKPKTIRWNGLEGVAAIAEHLGVCESTVYYHIKQQGSIEAGIETVIYNKEHGSSKNHKSISKQVGVRKPTAVNAAWKLALGMA